MKNFAIELATNILNIEMQKERLTKDNKLNERLCVCRKKILENFIGIAQLFYVRFTAKVVKFLEDFNIQKSLKIEDLNQWYNIEMYAKTSRDRPCVKPKMLLLYKLLQDKSDAIFFQHFEKEYKLLIFNAEFNDKDKFNEMVMDFFEDISHWIDFHILNILALKIDCHNIDDCILDDFDVSLTILNESKFSEPSKCEYSKECTECLLNTDKCPSMDLFKTEDIHLYITEELIQTKTIEDYFNILYRYHKNLKNVDLILDFKLVNEKSISLYFSKLLNKLFDNFKSIKIINHNNIDFSGNEEILKLCIKE